MRNFKMHNFKFFPILVWVIGGLSFACSHQEIRSPASDAETISLEDLTSFHSQCLGDKDCLIGKIQDESIIPSVKVYRSSGCSADNNGSAFTFRGDINGQIASVTRSSCSAQVPSLAANRYMGKYGSTIGSAKLQGGDCIDIYPRVDLSALCNFTSLVEIEAKLLRNKK